MVTGHHHRPLLPSPAVPWSQRPSPERRPRTRVVHMIGACPEPRSVRCARTSTAPPRRCGARPGRLPHRGRHLRRRPPGRVGRASTASSGRSSDCCRHRRWRRSPATASSRRRASPPREGASGPSSAPRRRSSSGHRSPRSATPPGPIVFWAHWAQDDLAEEHWHLGPVGVEPGFQGRGIGGALMRAVCAWLDEGTRRAWLETDKERNVRFYSGLGFEVADKATVARCRDLVHAAGRPAVKGLRVHLLDGTYELFRHFYGAPPRASSEGGEVGAVRGVVQSVLSMFAARARPMSASPPITSSSRSATTCGPATRRAKAWTRCSWPSSPSSKRPSWPWAWRCGRWSSSKPTTPWHRRQPWLSTTTGSSRFSCARPTRTSPSACAAAASCNSTGARTSITDEEAVRDRYGIGPLSIPDWLALVGDSADGFPGLQGWGKQSASTVLGHYEHLEAIPASASPTGTPPCARGAQRPQARRTAGVGHGQRAVVPRPGDAARRPLGAGVGGRPGVEGARTGLRGHRPLPARPGARRPGPSLMGRGRRPPVGRARRRKASYRASMSPVTTEANRRQPDLQLPRRIPVGNGHLRTPDRGRQCQQRLVGLGAQPRLGMRRIEWRRLRLVPPLDRRRQPRVGPRPRRVSLLVGMVPDRARRG